MRLLPLSLALVLASTPLASCKDALLADVEVASSKGGMRARAPAGPAWTCAPHDQEKESYAFAGIKCKHAEGAVLTAKLYEVDVADARTAQLFCMQDWKKAYGSLFRVVVRSEANVIDWRGFPGCAVTLEGTSEKGPWRVWELHVPNGRKMLQVSANGSLPLLQKHQAVVDAWTKDLRYDLTVPGQAAAPAPAP